MPPPQPRATADGVRYLRPLPLAVAGDASLMADPGDPLPILWTSMLAAAAVARVDSAAFPRKFLRTLGPRLGPQSR